jgi:hypothetical protein
MHLRTDVVQGKSNRKIAVEKLKINLQVSNTKPGPIHKVKAIKRDMNSD